MEYFIQMLLFGHVRFCYRNLKKMSNISNAENFLIKYNFRFSVRKEQLCAFCKFLKSLLCPHSIENYYLFHTDSYFK